jgi:hypothetical protein
MMYEHFHYAAQAVEVICTIETEHFHYATQAVIS